MIRTCPLMGYTYSRLGATLGSPKLRLLSLLSLLPPLSPCTLCAIQRELILKLVSLPRVLLCAAPPSNYERTLALIHTVPFRLC